MATQRTWVIEADPNTGEPDRNETRQLLVDLESVLHTVGGVFHVAADRQEVGQLGNGERLYRTVGLLVKWEAFAPARRAEPAEGPENGAVDLEPAPA